MTTEEIDKMIEQCVCHSTISTSRDQLRALVRMAVKTCLQAVNRKCKELEASAETELAEDAFIAMSRAIDEMEYEACDAIRNRKEQP